MSGEYVENELQGVAGDMKVICHRLLARDREARYATGREMAALERRATGAVHGMEY